MKVVYTRQAYPDMGSKSIFLVGPTLRKDGLNAGHVSWRVEALKWLEEAGYDGYVYVPEPPDANWQCDYMDQVEWEHLGLTYATVIAAWICRDMDILPGFTTNVEFGRYVTSGRLIYGRPDGAPKTQYLDWMYSVEGCGVPFNSLEHLMFDAAARADSSA